MVIQGHFTAPAKRLRAEHRPAARRTANSRTSFVPSDGRAVPIGKVIVMKTPFGRMWSMLRGDKYMVDASPAPADPAAAAPPDATGGDATDPAPPKEH